MRICIYIPSGRPTIKAAMKTMNEIFHESFLKVNSFFMLLSPLLLYFPNPAFIRFECVTDIVIVAKQELCGSGTGWSFDRLGCDIHLDVELLLVEIPIKTEYILA